MHAWSLGRWLIAVVIIWVAALAWILHQDWAPYRVPLARDQEATDHVPAPPPAPPQILAMQGLFILFENPAIPRQEILKVLEEFVESHLPGQAAPQTDETIALLRQMVREDEEHASRPKKSPEQLSRSEQIAELIFQLRDQQRLKGPLCPCEIFTPNLGASGVGVPCGIGPARKLLEMGFDAVPQLIEVLGDRRFTRVVGHGFATPPGPYVVRIGDCALAVLQQLADQSFDTHFTQMTRNGLTAVTRSKVQKWWQIQQTCVADSCVAAIPVTCQSLP